MKRKHLIHLLICALMVGGAVSVSSCSSVRGHWGIEGEYPGYGYGTPPPAHGHHKPPKPPKKPKKPKKHNKHCRHHHDD